MMMFGGGLRIRVSARARGSRCYRLGRYCGLRRFFIALRGGSGFRFRDTRGRRGGGIGGGTRDARGGIRGSIRGAVMLPMMGRLMRARVSRRGAVGPRRYRAVAGRVVGSPNGAPPGEEQTESDEMLVVGHRTKNQSENLVNFAIRRGGVNSTNRAATPLDTGHRPGIQNKFAPYRMLPRPAGRCELFAKAAGPTTQTPRRSTELPSRVPRAVNHPVPGAWRRSARHRVPPSSRRRVHRQC
jgi:hypothetical protein